MRRWAGLSLLLVSVVGCTNPSVAPPTDNASVAPTSDPPSDPAVCPAAGVTISAGVVEAAMGQRAVTLDLTNCGDAPYTVYGYPALELLDAEQRPVTVTTLVGPEGAVPDPGPTELVLQPGHRAVAVLSWRNTVTDGAAVDAEYLTVAPAPGEEPQTLALYVDLGTTGTVDLTAWQPGTAAR